MRMKDWMVDEEEYGIEITAEEQDKQDKEEIEMAMRQYKIHAQEFVLQSNESSPVMFPS